MAKSKKKRKERKYRLFYLLLLLFVTALSLSVSSYAWFTTNRLARVDLLDVNVRAQGGIEVSSDAVNWKAKININDLINARNNYSASLNQIPKTLEPVSSAGYVNNGLLELFYGVAEGNSNGNYVISASRSIEEEGFDENSDGIFIAFDLFFKTNENTRFYLTPESNITYGGDESVGIENAMRVAFVNEGNVNSGSSAYTMQSLTTNDNNNVYIWEPNYNSHTTSAIANALNTYGLSISSDNEAILYDGIKTNISKNLNILLNDAKESIYPNYFKGVNISYYTKTNFDKNLEIFSLNKGVTKVRVYMWIEGQDVDCENNASVGNVSLNLQFSKNPN
ncbi:MAG: hypothetical protein PUD07_05840 [bacterium]|nr:hypothetical protein [bacterium]